ncbi:hypothetical protein AYO22_06041 [Fonsecaea multimorphosa]|nr:hypothetical protein AYO22_06041 [Fonsecaea multimorphosa]
MSQPALHDVWYSSDLLDCSTNAAHQAFEEAAILFGSEYSQDKSKIHEVQSARSILELQEAAEKAQARYERKIESSKTRKWLARAASRVKFYGQIMDVMAQYHPEYVALAWGAMKFLFTTIDVHESTIRETAKGISQIAVKLPQIALAGELYRNNLLMVDNITKLYACVMKFLIRARRWYGESRILHAWHSVTRPPEIRYKDLLEDIESYASAVNQLAVSSSQAEQRDMHIKMDRLEKSIQIAESKNQKALGEHYALLRKLQQNLSDSHEFNVDAVFNARLYFRDMQAGQLMGLLEQNSKIDHVQALEQVSLARHFSSKQLTAENTPFWLEAKFRRWQNASSSASIVVKGSHKARLALQRFSSEAIELLRNAGIPVIWALPAPSPRTSGGVVGLRDILKNLLLQILKLRLQEGKPIPPMLNSSQVGAASTEDDWINLIAAALDGIPSLFAIFDLATLKTVCQAGHPPCRVFDHFGDLIRILASRRCHNVIKTIFLGYGAETLYLAPSSSLQRVVIDLKRMQSSAAPIKPRDRTRILGDSRSRQNRSSSTR